MPGRYVSLGSWLWPEPGIPDNPGTWLMTTEAARNRLGKSTSLPLFL
ncbi:hypothetical protein ACFW1P_24620 [Paenibacillus sp. NPDC058910]